MTDIDWEEFQEYGEYGIKGIHEGVSIMILQDMDAPDPRKDFDHLGTMICSHRDYELGDIQLGREEHPFEKIAFEEDLKVNCNACGNEVEFNYGEWTHVDEDEDDFICVEHPEVVGLSKGEIVILPLYLYDHSGITMSTSPFSCPWDSGQVGIIYMTHKKAKENWSELDGEELDAAIRECLIAEVKEYDQYLTGDVYGYIVNQGGPHQESCWGFFGIDSAKEEAISSADYISKEIAKTLVHPFI